MSKAITAVLLLAVALGVRADPVGDAEVSHHRNEKNVKRLVLYNNDFIGGQGGASEAPYSIGGYEYKVSCGSTTGPVVGSCSETGIYLTPPATGTQQALWQWSCTITASCGNSGTGTLNGLGKAPGGDWALTNSYPVTWTVEGGTGDFSRVIGGTVTFTADKAAAYNLFTA